MSSGKEFQELGDYWKERSERKKNMKKMRKGLNI
jgi:hypothetical protein